MNSIFRTIHFNCSSWLLTLLVSAYLMLMFNGIFFSTVYELHGTQGIAGWLYIASLFIFLLLSINLLLSLLAIPWLLKPTLIFFLISAAAAAYFMKTYNIMIDKTMIQNLMQTDSKESRELLSFNLLGYIFLTGIVPAWMVSRTEIHYGKPMQFFFTKLATTSVSIAVIGLIAIAFYQDYASLFRNHRHIRDLIVPINYINSLRTYAKQFIPANIPEFEAVALDSHLGESWKHSNPKKVVTVLVLGETARRANFSLYDYARETNPELLQEDIISFSNVSSCGTSTAVSVPCMFSRMDRLNYDDIKAQYSDNILDVIARSGIKVVWQDNNSGCKGVCERIVNGRATPEEHPEFCHDGECYDMVFLNQLQQTLEASDENQLIVLHQSGSHGPAYFLRTPRKYQKFTPMCRTNQLQECSQQEIINAYDNTILYTDHVLAQLIKFLKSQHDTIDASLVYISDHGESLGENNLYLHGIPYMIAPQEQTQVPMIVWMSDGFSSRFSLNKHCLSEKRDTPISHDNLFDSMLGLLDIKTASYQPAKDIFGSCHLPPQPHILAHNP